MSLKKFVHIVIIFILLLSALCSGGCTTPKAERTFIAMDTFMRIEGYCSDYVLKQAEDEIKRIEALLSVTNAERMFIG